MEKKIIFSKYAEVQPGMYNRTTLMCKAFKSDKESWKESDGEMDRVIGMVIVKSLNVNAYDQLWSLS